MKLFICLFLFFILFNKSYSGDIEWTISGVDDIKIVNINENHFYIKYQNSSQIETNTSLFGFQTCYGTVEVKGDDMDQTTAANFKHLIFCQALYFHFFMTIVIHFFQVFVTVI